MNTPTTVHPIPATAQGRPVRRARLTLTGIAAAITLAAALLVVLAVVVERHDPPPAPAPAPAHPDITKTHPVDGWDWDGEAALASASMPLLPSDAAAPTALAANPPARVLRLPTASSFAGPVAFGLPGSPEGAVAALTLLDETGLRGGDPQVYADAYRAVAVPGSPPAEQSRLYGLLTDMRDRGGLPPTGPVDGLTISYQTVQAQVKGLRDTGRFAVVCVLGQLTVDYQGRLLASGLSDCQALRYLPTTAGGGQWRISPGPAAVRAADAWPGSDDSFRTGYLEVQR
jgi:hypothetical protein